MKKKINLVLAALFSLSLLLPVVVTASEDKAVLKVGVVPQFSAEKIAKIWEPILAAVSKDVGVKLQLDGSLDIPSFEKRFNKGEFDIAYMNPYHAIVANKEAGYEPILRDVGRTLYGILVVKKGSDIKSVADLAGKKVAFPAPNALGAALIPRAEFATKHKIKVEEMYVSSHSSVYLNVILGIAQAGGGVQKTLLQQPDEIQGQLEVINKTAEVPPHPVTIHPRLGGELRDKVRAAFLKLGESVEGREMLSKIPMKVVGETKLSDYDVLREMGLDEFYIQ
ncbi:MAG: phosphate/phosphite/phosphonate ABC transporter substrate-binding protein [Thiolinea sp.]